MLTKERRIHLATEKASKPRLGHCCSFNSFNSRPLGIFPLQNVRLSYLVSGSLLNLPCSQCLLAQERAAKRPVIRNRVISGQGQSAAQVCVSLYPGCASQHRPPLLEPPPVKQRPGLQRTSVSSLLILLGIRFRSAFQGELLNLKEGGPVTAEGQRKGEVIQMPSISTVPATKALGRQECLSTGGVRTGRWEGVTPLKAMARK